MFYKYLVIILIIIAGLSHINIAKYVTEGFEDQNYTEISNTQTFNKHLYDTPATILEEQTWEYPTPGGAAGAGVANTITGSSVTYSRGGGGGHAGNTGSVGAPGVAGAAGGNNTGNGGNGVIGQSSVVGGAGGPGVVVVKEPSYPVPKTAPGVWSMNTVFDFVKDGNWV